MEPQLTKRKSKKPIFFIILNFLFWVLTNSGGKILNQWGVINLWYDKKKVSRQFLILFLEKKNISFLKQLINEIKEQMEKLPLMNFAFKRLTSDNGSNKMMRREDKAVRTRILSDLLSSWFRSITTWACNTSQVP